MRTEGYFYEQDFNELFSECEVDTEAFIEKVKEFVPLFEEIASQMDYDNLHSKEDLAEVLQVMRDIYSFGCSGGVRGFIYYSETSGFFDTHSEEILRYHKEMADSLGESFDSMVSKFVNGGNYILDLLNGGDRLKNDLVWGYLEGTTNYLLDSDFENFADCFTEINEGGE